jgi:hypothetical protein
MRIVFTLLTTILVLNVSAQRTTAHPKPVQDKDAAYYLRLSRQQKTLSSVLLVTGSLTAATGGLVWFLAPIAGLSETGDVEGAKRTGRTLVIAGGSLIGLSIPLHISARKNKEKALLYTGTSSIQLPLQPPARQMSVGLRIPIQ